MQSIHWKTLLPLKWPYLDQCDILARFHPRRTFKLDLLSKEMDLGLKHRPTVEPLPNGTLACRVHRSSSRAAVGPGKLFRVTQRPYHPDRSWGVNGWPDLRQGIFRPHSATPDLGVVQKKELIVVETDARKSGLLSVSAHPLLVRLNERGKEFYYSSCLLVVTLTFHCWHKLLCTNTVVPMDCAVHYLREPFHVGSDSCGKNRNSPCFW